jgi:CheY-like chemotaxis protein
VIERSEGLAKTVLVVDDNTEIREMLADAFLSDGFKKCEQADNGKEAIRLAKQIKPDLITLDLWLTTVSLSKTYHSSVPELSRRIPALQRPLRESLFESPQRKLPYTAFGPPEIFQRMSEF